MWCVYSRTMSTIYDYVNILRFWEIHSYHIKKILQIIYYLRILTLLFQLSIYLFQFRPSSNICVLHCFADRRITLGSHILYVSSTNFQFHISSDILNSERPDNIISSRNSLTGNAARGRPETFWGNLRDGSDEKRNLHNSSRSNWIHFFFKVWLSYSTFKLKPVQREKASAD